MLTEDIRAQTLLSETQNGYRLWSLDPYGAWPPLSTKRAERGWDVSNLTNILNGLALNIPRCDPGDDRIGRDSSKMMESLLYWTGGENGNELFSGPLPWDLDR